MTYIPTPVRTNNQKVSGTFYPLQKEELMALRKSRLINNAAYVHLALRFENPFCDRPIELAPKEFARRWTIPESSVYEALGRLKKLEIVNIKTGKIVISWAEDEGRGQEAGGRGQEAVLRRDSGSVECAGRGNGAYKGRTQVPPTAPHSFPAQEAQCFHSVDVDSSQPSPVDCQQAVISDNPDLLRDLRNDSGNSESILGSQNELWDSRMISDISENCGSEPLSNPDSSSPQTLQTLQKVQTLQTERAASKNEIESNQATVEKQVTAEEQTSCNTKSALTPLSNVLANPKDPVKDQPPRHKNDSQKTAMSVNECDLPQDLKNKLEELEIPLDAKVRKAISRHHISQAYGAAAHVERTWSTIDNPRAIFLYQLPKQPVEKAPKGLNQEFLDWYKSAVAEGIVENLPPQHLPTSCYNEPLVRLKRPDPLTGAPYTLVEWRRVQLEPDYEPNSKIASLKKVSSLEDIKELLEQLRQEKLGK